MQLTDLKPAQVPVKEGRSLAAGTARATVIRLAAATRDKIPAAAAGSNRDLRRTDALNAAPAQKRLPFQSEKRLQHR